MEQPEPIVVADVMAGVGPFAVPLSSPQFNGITVHANDLNPKSFEYLQKNAKVNKCTDERLNVYNMDGRVFIRHLEINKVHFDHVIMNLPATAIEFLDAFRGFSPAIPKKMPMIHVHCFVKYENPLEMETLAIKRCEKALGCSLSKDDSRVKVHIVRDVAPKKNMLCVSFILPEEVMALERVVLDDNSSDSSDKHENNEDDHDPKLKKARLE